MKFTNLVDYRRKYHQSNKVNKRPPAWLSARIRCSDVSEYNRLNYKSKRLVVRGPKTYGRGVCVTNFLKRNRKI